MRNLIFQIAWRLRRMFLKKPDDFFDHENDIMDMAQLVPYHEKQIALARRIAGPVPLLIIYGDSNGRRFWSVALRFIGYVIVVLAEPGSTPQELADYLESRAYIRNVRPHIRDRDRELSSSGGNARLRKNKMSGVLDAYRRIHRARPRLCNLEVPVVYFQMLDTLKGDPGHRKAIEKIDGWSRQAFKHQSFNTDLLTDQNMDGLVDPGRLMDIVHYADVTLIHALKLIKPIMDAIHRALGSAR